MKKLMKVSIYMVSFILACDINTKYGYRIIKYLLTCIYNTKWGNKIFCPFPFLVLSVVFNARWASIMLLLIFIGTAINHRLYPSSNNLANKERRPKRTHYHHKICRTYANSFYRNRPNIGVLKIFFFFFWFIE